MGCRRVTWPVLNPIVVDEPDIELRPILVPHGWTVNGWLLMRMDARWWGTSPGPAVMFTALAAQRHSCSQLRQPRAGGPELNPPAWASLMRKPARPRAHEWSYVLACFFIIIFCFDKGLLARLADATLVFQIWADPEAHVLSAQFYNSDI